MEKLGRLPGHKGQGPDSRQQGSGLLYGNQNLHRDPAEWMPPNKAYWHQYALNWVKIKNRWDLTANAEELDSLHGLLEGDVGIVYPREAPEDICTDTGTVTIQPWLTLRADPKMPGTAYTMDILGRRQTKIGRSLRPANRISLP
jgi:hypothetical protein